MSWAAEFGRLPSEVYEDYLAHQKDYRLLFSYRSWHAKVEQEQYEKHKRAAERGSRRAR